MACLRSLISPFRSSLSSSVSHSLPLARNEVSGKSGLVKSWPRHFEFVSPAYSSKFELISNTQRKIWQNLNFTGRKIFAGSFLGLSAATALMCGQPVVAHAMDDHYGDLGGPTGYLKDDLNTFWSLTRKFELPILLLVTVWLGWRHPITLVINIALLLLCTKPSPLSIYMFIEQLRERDMRKDPSPFKAKFLYVKNVKVDDYKVLCLAKVELRDVKLDVIGILGGWWVFQTSHT